MSLSMPLNCYRVHRDSEGNLEAGCSHCTLEELPAGAVRVEVHWSSLNYKDALAATGHPGVVRSFPHVPGIDAAGVVVESQDAQWKPGDEVVVTGCDLGAGTWGGWSQQIRVPGDWLVACPDGLTLRDCMVHGTAGMTAAACVDALQQHGIEARDGEEILVTGATGGVGSIAIMLLKQLGYQVVAVTGKPECTERVQQWGAERVLLRETWQDDSRKPLLRGQWRGGIDVAGGPMLGQLLRETAPGGTVAACGMVGGAEIPVTVYPFILRGVTLAGIDSVGVSQQVRKRFWTLLSGDWKLEWPQDYIQETSLGEVEQQVQRMLASETIGRILVRVAD